MSDSVLFKVTKPCSLVAAFDLDHTLIKPQGTRKFAKDRNDVQYLFPEVEEKLDDLRRKGYKIVIFTNQSGKKFNWDDLQYKVSKWIGEDTEIYVSTTKDRNRKPCTGMYDLFVTHNGYPLTMFYVGDAAGRNGDFSDSDLKFAHNIDVPFYTPEQFFLGESEKKLQVYNPLANIIPKPFTEPVPDRTLLLIVGPPACGKSSLSKELQQKYGGVVANNDTTGSSRKTLKLVRQAFFNQEPLIIVDNTNPSVKSREPYVSLAQDNGYTVWVIVNTLPLEACHVLNKYRSQVNRIHYTKWIPDIAYHMFRKNYRYPSETECDRIFEYVPTVEIKDNMLF
jgi:bifunctional polynucleotide phosphatase/kinase